MIGNWFLPCALKTYRLRITDSPTRSNLHSRFASNGFEVIERVSEQLPHQLGSGETRNIKCCDCVATGEIFKEKTMGAELEIVRQLVEQNPVPEDVLKGADMAWAIHRHGQIPDNYLVCEKVLWEKICQTLGYIPAHINCSYKGQGYISFSLNEISRRKL